MERGNNLEECKYSTHQDILIPGFIRSLNPLPLPSLTFFSLSLSLSFYRHDRLHPNVFHFGYRLLRVSFSLSSSIFLWLSFCLSLYSLYYFFLSLFLSLVIISLSLSFSSLFSLFLSSPRVRWRDGMGEERRLTDSAAAARPDIV